MEGQRINTNWTGVAGPFGLLGFSFEPIGGQNFYGNVPEYHVPGLINPVFDPTMLDGLTANRITELPTDSGLELAFAEEERRRALFVMPDFVASGIVPDFQIFPGFPGNMQADGLVPPFTCSTEFSVASEGFTGFGESFGGTGSADSAASVSTD